MATDIEYDIEVSKDKSTVKLSLSVPARLRARDPIIEVKVQNAIQILEDKGLRGYSLVDDGEHARLSNWDDSSRCAVWVFSNKQQAATTNVIDTAPVIGSTTVQPTSKKTTTGTKKSRTGSRTTKKRRTTVTTKES